MTVDEYFAAAEGVTRERLDLMRRLVKEEAPQAAEVISYGIPTFDLNGRHLIHYAGYKRHIGVYPTPHGIAAFDEELAAYPQGRGSVQFLHTLPFPEDLVRRMVRHQLQVVLSQPPKKPRSTT